MFIVFPLPVNIAGGVDVEIGVENPHFSAITDRSEECVIKKTRENEGRWFATKRRRYFSRMKNVRMITDLKRQNGEGFVFGSVHGIVYLQICCCIKTERF